jgi:hypothetical protein
VDPFLWLESLDFPFAFAIQFLHLFSEERPRAVSRNVPMPDGGGF